MNIIHCSIKMTLSFCYLVFISVFVFSLAGCGSSSNQSTMSSNNNPEPNILAASLVEINNSSIQLAKPLSLTFEPQPYTENYNNQLMALLERRRSDLAENSNPTFINALDGLFLRSSLSIMYHTAGGNTQLELQRFWQTVNDYTLDVEKPLLVSNHVGFQASETIKNNGMLFVQNEHKFKVPFANWVEEQLTPEIIALDFSTAFEDFRDQVNQSYKLFIPFPTSDVAGRVPDPSIAKLAYIENFALPDVKLSYNDNEMLTSYFIGGLKVGSENVTQINAIKLTGEYQRLNTAEGSLTLIPIENSSKLLAVVQPVLGRFEYYMHELPNILQDTLDLEPIQTSSFLPLLDNTFNHTNYKQLLESFGVVLPFDRTLADFTNLDTGGQYVSHFQHRSTLSLNEDGINLDSSGALMTVVNPDNTFFNIDIGTDSDGIRDLGVIFTAAHLPPCNMPDGFDNAFKLYPFAVAVIDSFTGMIDYIAEIKSVEGEIINSENCF